MSITALFIFLSFSSAAIAGNKEDCLQDADPVLAAIACPLFEAELAAARGEVPSATSKSVSAPQLDADLFLDKVWKLNPAKSSLTLTTTKQNTVIETHPFKVLDGTVSPDGTATLNIDLSSLETNIDIRNVRMRFLFFETFQFPIAEVTTALDLARMSDLKTGASMTVPLEFSLNLHGITKTLTTDIAVSRFTETAVNVTSLSAIVINADEFGLYDGVVRLSEAASGISIDPSAKVAFDLLYEAEEGNSDLAAARDAQNDRQVAENTRPLSPEECMTRMDVISKTRNIYFRTGSAAVERSESAPVLDEVAQFFGRCPSVAMEISGHTDSVGGQRYNQDLSERRARSVADELERRGVASTRLVTRGYGFEQPVDDNETTEGRAKNRRIEFRAN
jgi:outer membrane protein OmpA-like peptidoglycan-associated protein